MAHRRSAGFTLIELPAVRKGERTAFTLIELLVVIAVISLLASLVMPALNTAILAADRASCATHLRQIGNAYSGYLTQHEFWSHSRPNGHAPNWGLWEKPLGTPLGPGHPDVYWGIPYAAYLGNERGVFRCPSAQKMWAGAGYTDWANQPEVTYGLNDYTSGKLIPTKFRNAAGSILCHDAYEHLLDGNGDLLAIRAGDSINLTQWRHIPGAVFEYFRHLDKCNVLWLDGHASAIPECGEYPMKAYTGK